MGSDGPRRYSIRRSDCPEGAVYVGRGRGSDHGNPFTAQPVRSRAEAVALFRPYAEERAAADPSWLAPLRGRDLSCWCLASPCHADVLLELSNA